MSLSFSLFRSLSLFLSLFSLTLSWRKTDVKKISRWDWEPVINHRLSFTIHRPSTYRSLIRYTFSLEKSNAGYFIFSPFTNSIRMHTSVSGETNGETLIKTPVQSRFLRYNSVDIWMNSEQQRKWEEERGMEGSRAREKLADRTNETRDLGKVNEAQGETLSEPLWLGKVSTWPVIGV